MLKIPQKILNLLFLPYMFWETQHLTLLKLIF
jgi:hypothetical protein